MCNKVNTDLALFCPCSECKSYQKTDNKITKDGVYKTKTDSEPRHKYRCHGGNHRFSETRYSDLHQKQGSFKESELAIGLTTYGLSHEQVADVLERALGSLNEIA